MAHNKTYWTIASRLAALNPPIHIGTFIADSGLNREYETTLEGIKFFTDDMEGLLKALRACKDADGMPAFAEGYVGDRSDPMLAASYSQTHGIGFRQIWRPKLSDRPLSLEDYRPNRFRQRWDPRFNEELTTTTGNQSSLHCAVAKDYCNIHIDEMGFVVRGAGDLVVIDLDAVQHGVNELFYKTFFMPILPDWMIDRFSIILPNSTNNYMRAGFSFDLKKTETYRVRFTAECSVFGQTDYTAGFSVSGRHDLLGFH